jgi:rSAM/selenodomain-associated transferase 2
VKTSIIIPTLNEEACLAETIESTKRLAPHELIVVDGGSSDGTPDIAQRLSSRVIESDRGRAAQQNAGAAIAGGEVLFFLHADCRPPSDALEQIERALADERVVCGAFRQRIEARGWRYRLLEAGNSTRVRWLNLPYGDQGIFVRRSAFEEVGGFPQVPLMEDLRLMRALRRQGRVALLRGPLTVSARRWQRHGVVGQTLRNWTLLLAERVGVSPDRLARFYRPHAEK